MVSTAELLTTSSEAVLAARRRLSYMYPGYTYTHERLPLSSLQCQETVDLVSLSVNGDSQLLSRFNDTANDADSE